MPKNMPFEYALEIGERFVIKTITHLNILGYTTQDMSKELMPNGHYPPFDILAVKDGITYIIDVKARSSRRNLWFPTGNLLTWELYPSSAIKSIIFAVESHYRYITVLDVSRLAYHKRSPKSFHINYEDTIDL